MEPFAVMLKLKNHYDSDFEAPQLRIRRSKTSESKDHVDALERRLQLWERGDIKSLLLEAETIQQRLTSNNNPKNIAGVSKFAKLMGK